MAKVGQSVMLPKDPSRAVQSMEFTQDAVAAIFSLQRQCDVLIEKQDYSEAKDVATKCVNMNARFSPGHCNLGKRSYP